IDGQLVGAELPLGGPGARGLGVEEHKPEGAGWVLSRALVHGVPDPRAPAAPGFRELQVEALVMPRLLRDLGEACRRPHEPGRYRSPLGAVRRPARARTSATA